MVSLSSKPGAQSIKGNEQLFCVYMPFQPRRRLNAPRTKHSSKCTHASRTLPPTCFFVSQIAVNTSLTLLLGSFKAFFFTENTVDRLFTDVEAEQTTKIFIIAAFLYQSTKHTYMNSMQTYSIR